MRTLLIGLLVLVVGCAPGSGSTCQVTCADGSKHETSVSTADGGDACELAIASVCPPATGDITCSCQSN